MELNIEQWTDKKLNIVETTMAKVAKQGFEHVTTAKIAKQAGVGEGTIYRHFTSKDELIDITAEYAALALTANIRNNYRPDATVEQQFLSFCVDFIDSGQHHEEAHRYLNHYMNTPQGLAYRRMMFGKMGVDLASARPLFYPLNLILQQGREEGLIKDMPMPVNALMAISTLVFVVGDAALGLITLNPQLVSSIAQACWDGVKK